MTFFFETTYIKQHNTLGMIYIFFGSIYVLYRLQTLQTLKTDYQTVVHICKSHIGGCPQIDTAQCSTYKISITSDIYNSLCDFAIP